MEDSVVSRPGRWLVAVALALGIALLTLYAIASFATGFQLGWRSVAIYGLYSGVPITEFGLVGLLGARSGLGSAAIAAWSCNFVNLVIAAVGAFGRM